ncbi:MAG: GAF domain-containing protein [Terriglobales bacterium]
MLGSAQPEERFPPAPADSATAGTDRPSSVSPGVGAAGDASNGSRVLAETELDSALQLLVERAQYITGATGTALALPHGDQMVCRASAGSSAPAVGARLQVRSGLTGESIVRRQLLRCDNAETDPRVNLEACRALGIASIVVLPLLRRNGDVRGLFELFSDHPYAFEERDLVALERMAGLTLTALDLAEQRQNSAPAPKRASETPVEPPLQPLPEPPAAGTAPAAAAIPLSTADNVISSAIPSSPQFAAPSVLPAEPPAISLSSSEAQSVTSAAPAPLPDAMMRVQKCAACGFPVSEGRTLCLDCERKESERKKSEQKQREWEQSQIPRPQAEPAPDGRDQAESSQADSRQSDSSKTEAQAITPSEPEQDLPSDPAAASAAQNVAQEEDEFVPAFLANSTPAQESWLADHVNLLAIVVLILGILVAIVVFR